MHIEGIVVIIVNSQSFCSFASASSSSSCPASLLDFWPFLSRSESVFLFQFWTAAKEDIRRITLLKKLSSYKCRSRTDIVQPQNISPLFSKKLSKFLIGSKSKKSHFLLISYGIRFFYPIYTVYAYVYLALKTPLSPQVNSLQTAKRQAFPLSWKKYETEN